MISAAPRVHFPRDDGFHEDLKARAEAWLARTGKRASGDASMKAKTATIFAWHLGAYALLLAFGPGAPLLSAALVLSLALSTVGIGFAIMHDANHGSWSSRRFVNRLVGLSLDAVGGSSYVWRHKHNVRHHTYANIEGLDADLEAEPFLRLAPGQRRRAWHRFQHLYAWPIYGFLAPKWWLVDDAKDLLTGRIGKLPFPRPPAGELALAVLGKMFFLTWSLAVPLVVFRTPWVIAYWFGGAMIAGVVLAVVFQLAHVVPAAEFHAAGEPGRKMPTGWAEHQVRTTVDFAPGSPLLTWYLGGLNYQVVHHLLPMYCHVHYPALAGIVAETCRDHGIPYRSEPTLVGALRGHGRLLRELGKAPVVAPLVSVHPEPVEGPGLTVRG